MLNVPTQLVNECLGRLEELKLVAPLRAAADETESDARYQPARPLTRTTLFEFKTLDENLGENTLGASLDNVEPLLDQYDAALAQTGQSEFFQKSIEQLLAADREKP